MKISRPMINNFRSHSKGLLLCQVSQGFHFNGRFCKDLHKEEDRHQTMNIPKKIHFYITYIELAKLAMEFSIFQFFQINHLSWVNLRCAKLVISRVHVYLTR
jgi:hypothetical protein